DEGAVSVNPEDGTIDIDFGSEVNDAAAELSNYKIDNEAIPTSGTDITFVVDKQHVRITLADSFEIPADADYKFEISQNIKNEEGETLVADKTDAEEGNPSNWNTNIGLLDNIAPELEGAIYAVESSNAKQTEKIKLT